MLVRHAVLACALLACTARFPFARDPYPEDDLAERIETLARELLDEGGADGLSLAVALGDDVLIADGWGYADPDRNQAAAADSTYRVGSLSAQLVALALLGLAEEGRLALEDPVSKHLPELELQGGTVTLQELLTHTSGLPGYSAAPPGVEGIDAKAVLAWLSEQPLQSAPGTCFAYSESDDLLAGLVLERLAELPVPEVLAARIFEPLELADTRYCWEGPALHEAADRTVELRGDLVPARVPVQPFAAEGLCSTASDLLRFQRALVAGELVGPGSYERMTASARLPDGTRTGYGLAVNLTELGELAGVSYGGGMAGARVHVAHYPDHDLTLVLLASGEAAPLERFERRIARLVLDLPDPEVRDVPLTGEERKVYLGAYFVGCIQIQVDEHDGRLVLRPQIGVPHPLKHQGGHAFVSAEDPDVRVTFDVQGGRALGLVLDDHGLRTEAKRL